MDYDLNTVRAAYHSLRLKAHRVLALLCVFDFLFCILIWVVVGQVRLHAEGIVLDLPPSHLSHATASVM